MLLTRMLRAERRTAHDSRVYRDRFTQGVLPSVRRGRCGERLWEGRFRAECRRDRGVSSARDRWGARDRGRSQRADWSFVDALTPSGARICVVDPRKTQLKAGVAAKTDRLDARRLADALRRDSVVSIYVPPPAIRELREVCRGRHQLVRLRTRLAQMIRALLLRCDADEPPGTRLYAPKALAWLDHVALRPDAQAALRRLVTAYRAVHTEAQAADDGGAHPRGDGSDCDDAGCDGRRRAGPRADAARRDRRHRPLPRRAARWPAMPASCPRVEQSAGPCVSRADYAARVPVVALGAGRSGAARDSSPGCDRPMGAAAHGPEGDRQGPRRARPRAVRRDCDHVAATVTRRTSSSTGGASEITWTPATAARRVLNDPTRGRT